MAPEHEALFSYCNAVLEPWDGPAAICAHDGQWVVAGMDRNGLRPMRFITHQRWLLVVGSEAGMVEVPKKASPRKAASGPARSSASILDEGRFYHDTKLKDLLAKRARLCVVDQANRSP